MQVNESVTNENITDLKLVFSIMLQSVNLKIY